MQRNTPLWNHAPCDRQGASLGAGVSATYCRVCGDNLHWLEKRVLVGPCSGNPHNAMESHTCAAERLLRAMESLTQCSGKLYFTNAKPKVIAP